MDIIPFQQTHALVQVTGDLRKSPRSITFAVEIRRRQSKTTIKWQKESGRGCRLEYIANRELAMSTPGKKTLYSIILHKILSISAFLSNKTARATSELNHEARAVVMFICCLHQATEATT